MKKHSGTGFEVRHTCPYVYNWLIHPLLSPVTIPQVVAVNENVFSVNVPGKITDKCMVSISQSLV
jgi:hypothetical protein